MNQSENKPSQHGGDAPVRFVVPEALLQQLRARRAHQRAQPGWRPSTDSDHKPLSIVELVNAGDSGEAPAHIAKAYVDDMNALQTQVVDFKIICVVCFGRGEVDERLLGQAREHGLA